MTQDDWTDKLEELIHRYPIKVREGIDETILSEAEGAVGELPNDLRSLYKVTNGLRYEWFNFLPIERRTDITETWDGMKRANNKQTTKFFGGSKDLLDRFIIIAEIGAGYCACINRHDGSIWFQDTDRMHQTNLTLSEFLETTLREVAEL